MYTVFHRPYDRLSGNNAVLLVIDHQVGLLWDANPPALKRNVLALAKAATLLGVPSVITATLPEHWGPTLPELQGALANTPAIRRTTVNAWSDPAVRSAVLATGRRKLVITGSSADTSVALTALAAASEGYDVYVAIDATGSLLGDSTITGTLRMLEAGITVANTGALVIEMLGDSADPRAREVYSVLDLPYAALLGQEFGELRVEN